MSTVSRRTLLAGIAALPAAFGTRADAAAERGTLRIGFQRSSTLTYLLKLNGGLEKALEPLNIGVSWHEFTSGLPILEALNLGRIDFSADVADTVPVFAQAAGARIVYVAEEAASPTAQAIVVPGDSAIRSIADLKGKKIAVTKGAGSHYLLLAALGTQNLSFKDIKPAYLNPADGRTALVGGSVDAWVAWDPFLASAQQQSGVRVVVDGTGLASYKRYYLTSEAFADRHPDALATIFETLRNTGEWAKSHSDEVAATLSTHWGIAPAVIAAANQRRADQVGPVR
ncbi:MAG: aliphatic sulfonate transporter substrate-binding protein, partial [Enterovirga sp.]|nr:aliphatic sulfonate transporter substrate-binding protein [Enterovirga sp.]